MVRIIPKLAGSIRYGQLLQAECRAFKIDAVSKGWWEKNCGGFPFRWRANSVNT